MSIITTEKTLAFELPCTQTNGKIRIKTRESFSDYGIPIAPRRTPITEKCYLEWQIGYDLLATAENRESTTLKDITFTNYRGDRKYIYELSEILYYSLKRGLISHELVALCCAEIKSFTDFADLEKITRTKPKEVMRNGIKFSEMSVTYPLLVHSFCGYDVHAEIMVREKQRAVGIQPMLYVCLPIKTLRFSTPVEGRTLNAKETAKWIIEEKEAALALNLFRIFGMLSKNHQFDVIQILETILKASVSDKQTSEKVAFLLKVYAGFKLNPLSA